MSRKKRVSKNRIFLSLLMAVSMLIGMACPFVSKAQEGDSQVVRVGYNYMPSYYEIHEDGSMSGYGYDFLQMISGYGNFRYEYVGYDKTTAEIEQMLVDGEVDIITRVQKTEENQKRFDFSDHRIGTVTTLLTAKEGDPRFDTYDIRAYNGLRVGMLSDNGLNMKFEEFAEENRLSYTPVYFEDIHTMMAALQTGEKIDVMVSTSLREISNEMILEEMGEVPLYACVRKGNRELLEKLNVAIDMLDRMNASWQKDLELKYYSSAEKNGLLLTGKERAYLRQFHDADKSLRVLLNPEHSPYSMVLDDKPTGIAVDIFEEVAAMLHIKYEYVIPDSVEEFDIMLRERKIDVILDVNFDYYTAEQLGYQLTTPYMKDSVAMIHRVGESDSDEVKKVAVRPGDALLHPMNAYGPEDAEWKVYDSAEACVQAVIDGDADATYACTYLAQIEVQRDYKGRVTYSYMPSADIPFCMGINKEVDAVMFSLINEGIFSLGNERIQTIVADNAQTAMSAVTLTSFLYSNPLIFVGLCIILFGIVILVVILMFRHKMINQERAKNKELEEAAVREKEAKEAVEEAFVAANRANAAKTEFLANMSHDIRTPMNAIMGMTMIAGTHLDDKTRVADCLNKITVSGKHLLGLINEVLDMSKIESGKVDLQEEDFSLAELIDNLIIMSRSLIEAKKQELNVTITNVEHENVVGDAQRVQQAFMNLMSNAVKYTPEGGKIRLDITEKPTHRSSIGCYEFVFEDNGIGMSEEYVQHIFEPFTRAKDGRIDKIQGTGLGMAITQNIVHMMNGTIQVESELDKGTKFIVTIFLKIQDKDDNFNMNLLENLPVLVADDDQITCESACEILDELGMQGEWVLSGEEAVEKAAARHKEEDDYFAVVLDWKMPGMSGVETARKIREQVGDEVPIIILSAYDWSNVEAEARAIGVNAFITKPLFKSKIAHLFAGLLGHSHAAEQDKKMLDSISEENYEGKRVLLVEDNDLNAEIAGEILKMTGLEVDHVVNGKEAFDLMSEIEDNYYDIVFMDVQMPIMTGYEATRAIRALPKEYAKNVPIVAMTANAYADDVREAENSGMNGHIAKPLELDRLLETLQKWLS